MRLPTAAGSYARRRLLPLRAAAEGLDDVVLVKFRRELSEDPSARGRPARLRLPSAVASGR